MLVETYDSLSLPKSHIASLAILLSSALPDSNLFLLVLFGFFVFLFTGVVFVFVVRTVVRAMVLVVRVVLALSCTFAGDNSSRGIVNLCF